MANGYDAHSLKATGLDEASSSDMAKTGLSTAVRDKRFTRSGIGYRTQQEASTLDPGGVGQNPPPIMYGDGYAGGTAARQRGMVNESAVAWQTAQEATSPQIRPRDTLPPWGLNEALPPWLKDKGDEEKEALPPWLQKKDGSDEEQKEAAVAWVRENMGGFPCEDDARIALAVLSQFVDGDTLDSIRSAIEDQFGDPADRPVPVPMDDYAYGDPDEDEYSYAESDGLKEAPLDAKKRNALDDSDFALPGRKYPIDTPERARSALARVQQFGSDSDKSKVLAAVKKKYPDMKVG